MKTWDKAGVSATHIDWTMVPYVRFSFYKHFKDGLKYIDDNAENFNMDEEKIKSTSINDDIYTQHFKAYKYAEDLTEREIYQAVEGLYHNLKIWA